MASRHRKGRGAALRRQRKTPNSFKKRAIRAEVLERDGLICHWCARDDLQDDDETKRDTYATMDHLLKHADGGTYHPSNLVVACRSCNSKRHEGE